MYEKFRFSMNGFMYFFMWSMFNFNVICGLCPAVFNGGYVDPSCGSELFCDVYCNPGFVKTFDRLFCVNGVNWVPDTNSVCKKTVKCLPVFNGGSIESSCSRLPGNSCTFYCDPGFVKKGNQLTCGKDGMWIQDTNSICIKSVEQTSSYSGQADVASIVGITTPFLIVTIIAMIIIIRVCVVVWKLMRSSGRKSQRSPGHAGGTCLRLRENRDQNVTTLRQQPNADGTNSVSSFEFPSYNGIYDHSFEQRIPTISSRCKYPEPPPSYSEAQTATNEAPPTYIEVVTDPTRFNLYI